MILFIIAGMANKETDEVVTTEKETEQVTETEAVIIETEIPTETEIVEEVIKEETPSTETKKTKK